MCSLNWLFILSRYQLLIMDINSMQSENNNKQLLGVLIVGSGLSIWTRYREGERGKNSRIKQIVLAISLSKVTLAKSERSISRSCKSFSICASFSLTKRYRKQIIHRINSEVMTSHNISVKKQKKQKKLMVSINWQKLYESD